MYQAQVKKYNEYVRVQEEKKSKNKGGDFKNDVVVTDEAAKPVVKDASKTVVQDAAKTVTEEVANMDINEEAPKTEQ